MELYQDKPEAATKGGKTGDAKEEPKNLLAGGAAAPAGKDKKWDVVRTQELSLNFF